MRRIDEARGMGEEMRGKVGYEGEKGGDEGGEGI